MQASHGDRLDHLTNEMYSMNSRIGGIARRSLRIDRLDDRGELDILRGF